MKLYIVPQIGTGTRNDMYRAKYFDVLGADWSAVDIGESFLVNANTNPAQDAAVTANADVLKVPPLDNTIALVATQNALEDLGLPAHWITADMTYRQVLRVVIGLSYLVQRCQAQGLRMQMRGHLDNAVGSLSVANRNRISAAIDSFGLDRSWIISSTTVREVLRGIGQQFVTGGAQMPWGI